MKWTLHQRLQERGRGEGVWGEMVVRWEEEIQNKVGVKWWVVKVIVRGEAVIVKRMVGREGVGG